MERGGGTVVRLSFRRFVSLFRCQGKTGSRSLCPPPPLVQKPRGAEDRILFSFFFVIQKLMMLMFFTFFNQLYSKKKA